VAAARPVEDLGGLAVHLAELPAWGVVLIDQAEFDLDHRKPTDRPGGSVDELLALYDANVSLARRAVASRTDAELLRAVDSAPRRCRDLPRCRG
jgi:hypothetical protein